jgi:hypothetical protein
LLQCSVITVIHLLPFPSFSFPVLLPHHCIVQLGLQVFGYAFYTSDTPPQVLQSLAMISIGHTQEASEIMY